LRRYFATAAGFSRVRRDRLEARRAGERDAAHGYDAYLAHMRATHPDETPLERGEFLAWALERRYAGRGPRCC
jgi:hypothetical protein